MPSLINQNYFITFIIALGISVILMPELIKLVKSGKLSGQPIRKEGPKSHQKKSGTPTMGGVVILVAILVTALATGEFTEPVCCLISAMLAIGVIGVIDDYAKISQKSNKGLSGKIKILWQLLLSIGLTYYSQSIIDPVYAYKLYLPGGCWLDLGYAYYILGFLVIAGTANAVNLTDGLDGLVTGPALMCLVFLLSCLALAVTVWPGCWIAII